MQRRKGIATLVATALALSVTISSSFVALADENVTFGAVNVTTVDRGNGMPRTVTNVVSPEGMNLDQIVQGAGLDALGEGNNPPDSILGLTPMVHYELRNAANGIIAGTESNLNTYLYSPGGFSRLYMEHSGVARYYFRVFTQKGGWMPWQNSKENTPNPDDSSKVQALQLRVKGHTKTLADLYYRVVLNDGTVLDWAKNGQTTGTIGTDKYIVAIKIALWNRTVPFTQPTTTLMEAPNYEGPYFDKSGNVQYSKADGSPYTGWAFFNEAQYYFSEGSRAVGWQYVNGQKFYFAEDGKLVTDLEPIMGLPGSYQIKVNKATRTLTVLAPDGANGYIIPFKTYQITNGPDTPLGTYKTYVKYQSKIMHDNIYCRYLTRFYKGFLMHSLIYVDSGAPTQLDPNTYNFMDEAKSDGCIRLKAGEAHWIFSNVPLQTPVTIYEDMWDKGPIERPAVEKVIPTSQRYDPTDPVMAAQHAIDQAARDAADAPRIEAIKAAQLAEATARGDFAESTATTEAAQTSTSETTATEAVPDTTAETEAKLSHNPVVSTSAPSTTTNESTEAPGETVANP